MDLNQETLNTIAEMVASKLANAAVAAPAAVGPYAPVMPTGAMPAGAPMTAGGLISPAVLSLRTKIPLPDGREASGYLHFDARSCPTAAHIAALADQISRQWPVDAWFPKQNNGYPGGQGGGGGRPSYGRRY